MGKDLLVWSKEDKTKLIKLAKAYDIGLGFLDADG